MSNVIADCSAVIDGQMLRELQVTLAEVYCKDHESHHIWNYNIPTQQESFLFIMAVCSHRWIPVRVGLFASSNLQYLYWFLTILDAFMWETDTDKCAITSNLFFHLKDQQRTEVNSSKNTLSTCDLWMIHLSFLKVTYVSLVVSISSAQFHSFEFRVSFAGVRSLKAVIAVFYSCPLTGNMRSCNP